MIIIYRISAFIFIVCFAQISYAQNGMLSGKLLDEAGEGISYANVAILKATDSSLVTGTVTAADGSFNVKTPAKGSYFLRMSAIGFVNTETAAFEIISNDFNKDFGTVILKEDVRQLEEVTVMSLRPTIVNEIDKMVVSVEGTALAAGSTAFEILGKAPGVWIDQNGNIQLNGKAGVRIMIDGRPTYLSARELQNMLEGMSAENIRNIEIITNPSAKYEAEGASGIINITLKKNKLLGINGSIYAGYEYRAMHGYSGGGTINYKKGKWSSFATLDMSRRTRVRTSHMLREFNEGGNSTKFDQEGREEVIRYTPSLRLGTDYDINDRHSIGVMANLSYHDGEHDFRTDSYLTNGIPENNLFIDADNYTRYKFGNGTFNLHYVGELDTTGTTLSADLDYVRLSNKGNAEFYNRYYSLENNILVNEDLLTSDNPTYYDIYSAKVDFSKQVKEIGKLELGLKASYVQSDNLLDFYSIENGQKILDEKRSNHFIYKEHIYAAYANFSVKLGEKWNVQGGLRAEQTIAEGKSVTLDQTTPRDYLNLFPSIFIQQKISDNYQISYNYSRRINRPRYDNLNPFIFYLDPYTWAQGNPYLKPQYTNSFEVKQTFKNSYNLILGYAITEDFIAEIPEQNNENKTTVFSQRNVDNFKNISATLVTPLQITPKWGMNNNVIFAYQDYTTILDEQSIENEQVFFMAQSTNNFQLPKGLKLEISTGYQGPLAHGLYKIESQWWVDAGIKRSFMDDKLDLSLNVSDIFRSRQVIGSANIDGNINFFDQYFSAQSFKINLRYMFNKGEKFEMKKRNTNLEELNRAGGS